VISAAAYFVFLRSLNNKPNIRYYVALLCLLAAAAELITAKLCRFRWVRVARLVVVIAMAGTLPFVDWPKIVERETIVDLLAKNLQRYARPNDLIVVNPWFHGPTFNWYYHGAAHWMTLPDLSEKRIHRYDLLKARMAEPDPMADIRAAISRTLQSGNRVWLVGGAQPPTENLLGYDYPFSMQLGAFLRQHVVDGEVVLGLASGVNVHENNPLLIARGWKD
jgi:hypothetical protein